MIPAGKKSLKMKQEVTTLIFNFTFQKGKRLQLNRAVGVVFLTNNGDPCIRNMFTDEVYFLYDLNRIPNFAYIYSNDSAYVFNSVVTGNEVRLTDQGNKLYILLEPFGVKKIKYLNY